MELPAKLVSLRSRHALTLGGFFIAVAVIAGICVGVLTRQEEHVPMQMGERERDDVDNDPGEVVCFPLKNNIEKENPG